MTSSAEQPRFIGARIQRLEDPRLVRGLGRYIDDLVLPGMLHMRLVRSELAHAKLTSIDTSMVSETFPQARIFTGADIGDLAIRAHANLPTAQHSLQPILAQDRVRFVGEPIAAVLLEDAYAVEDAAEQVFVDYEPLPVLADIASATAPGAAPLFDGWRNNLYIEQSRHGGDMAAARAAAAHVIKRTYRNQRQAGVPMECRGVIANLDPAGETLTVWSSTQIPHLLRTYLSEELGWPENAIQVIAPEVGGGFGVKGHVFAEEVLVAWLAIQTRRPVKWIEDRREHLIASIHAREHVHTVEAYVAADGKVLGLKIDVTADVGAYSVFPFTAASDPGMVGKVMPGPYDLKAYEATIRAVVTNKCPLGTYRGVGRPAAVFSQERLMDEIAVELGIDPITLRERNLIPSFPYKNVLGFIYDEGSYAESLRKVRELLAPDIAAARNPTSPNIRTGVGLALFLEQTAHGTPDFVRRKTPIETGYESAKVEMHPDGRVTVFTGLQCHGQGHETIYKQIVCDRLGLDPNEVYYVQGDTDQVFLGEGTGGSRSATIGGSAMNAASDKIVAKASAIAAHMLGVAQDDLQFAEGVFSSPKTNATVTIKDVAKAAIDPAKLPEGMELGLVATAIYNAPEQNFPNGCHVCEVEIDPETGHVDIVRYNVVDDVGTVLNPLLLKGQIVGGIAQGAGQILMEDIQYEHGSGQLLTGSFMDYAMPRAADLSAVEVKSNPVPTPTNPLGVKGAGEAGTVGAMPALANAIVDALSEFGVKDIAMPATPERIWRAIQAAGRA